MLFPRSIIEQIAKSAYWADRTIRSELALGLIANEDDYSSNLTSVFRRQINARAIPNLRATSYILPAPLERTLGADGCVILSNTREFKVCLFEAKWPRLRTRKDYWDFRQKASGISHFHEQLLRQAPFSHSIAIWEMFYCEFPFSTQPSFMPSHGSSCVWHEEAFNFSMGRVDHTIPWNDLELSDLLSKHGARINDFIQQVCLCNKGMLFRGNEYLAVFADYGIPRELILIEYASVG